MTVKRKYTHILSKAEAAINDRLPRYGHPEINFDRIARVWEWWLTERNCKRVFVEPRDVAVLYALGKLARDLTKTSDETLIDVAGYMGTAGMLRKLK